MSLETYFGGRIYYVWKVNDPDIGRYVRSPFISLNGNEFKFSVAAYLSYENYKEWWLSIFHRRSNNWKWKMIIFVKVRCGQLAFLTCMGTPTVQHDEWIPLWSGTHFDSEFIVDGTITFVFSFDEFLENITEIVLGEKQVETVCLQELSVDIEKIYDNYESADIVLKCEDELFPVHCSVLQIRAVDFYQKLKRTKRISGSVAVSDMDCLTLKMFLKFLYSGTVDLWTTNAAFKLYYAAHRYSMRSLKLKCGSYMVQNLSVRIICEVFALAFTHEDADLLQSVVIFAAENDNFLLSSEWLEFASRRTELAVSFFNEILSIS